MLFFHKRERISMHNFLSRIFIVLSLLIPTLGHSNILDNDTSDPLYIQPMTSILSKSTITYWDHILRAGQSLSYGLNDRLSVGINIHYQHDFNGNEDGFAATDLGATYRIATASDNNSGIISDVLFGFKFGGSSQVRTPYYADSTYYAGLRFGRQWAGMTLSGTIKSSWIFDDLRGMAYLDFIPQAYFRIAPDWRFGTGLTIRVATNQDRLTGQDYDQEWLHFNLVRQFGRTQYSGHIDYEFESDDIQVGAQVNILF